MHRAVVVVVDAVLTVGGLLLKAVFQLSGWRMIQRWGRLAGRVRFAADRVQREVIEAEFARLFGGTRDAGALRTITRKSFENDTMRLFETAFFGSMDRRATEAIASVEGLEHVDAALARGRGVIMLLSHFGSFLLPLPFLGFRGYVVNQITGKQVHASFLAERVWRYRKKEADRLPVKFTQVDRFLRPVYEALRGNEIVAIAFDGRDSTKWATVDFFGRKARFSTGPFELARRTGAAIVPTFVIRGEGGRHRITFGEEFGLSGDPDPAKALDADVGGFARIFQEHVALFPCHFGTVLYKLRRAAQASPATALFVEA